MNKFIKEIIVGVIVALIVGIISVLINKCDSNESEDNLSISVSIRGKVIDPCTYEPVKNVDIKVSTIIDKKLTTDDDGVFEVKISGTEPESFKFIFLNEEFVETRKTFYIEFDKSIHELGEIPLNKDNCNDCEKVTGIINTFIDRHVETIISKNNKYLYHRRRNWHTIYR